jgi:hypothetical protein
LFKYISKPLDKPILSCTSTIKMVIRHFAIGLRSVCVV